MFEAKPENVEAIETMVTIRDFCLEVNMLYGGEGATAISSRPFASSVIVLISVKGNEVSQYRIVQT